LDEEFHYGAISRNKSIIIHSLFLLQSLVGGVCLGIQINIGLLKEIAAGPSPLLLYRPYYYRITRMNTTSHRPGNQNYQQRR
jgi:hypothetical protein